MIDLSSDRRTLLKQAGLGIGLAASGTPFVGGVYAAQGPKTKQLLETEVLVVGGGPAGIGAALGAARTGVKTTLIESYGFLGGVATWSLGMPINQMRPMSKPRSVVHEVLIEKLVNYGDQAVHIGQHQLYCHVDYLKVAILDALEEVGCKFLVHLSAVDTLMEGNRVAGVVVSTKQGLATIRAKVVIDCSGDADVAYFAGAETMMETVEPRMPNTTLLNFANITAEQIRRSNIRDTSKRASGKYPLLPRGWGMAAGKSMGNCVATGHAAGLAAAISAKRGITPREVKVAEIQDALRKDGVDLTMAGKVQENVSSDRKA